MADILYDSLYDNLVGAAQGRHVRLRRWHGVPVPRDKTLPVRMVQKPRACLPNNQYGNLYDNPFADLFDRFSDNLYDNQFRWGLRVFCPDHLEKKERYLFP